MTDLALTAALLSAWDERISWNHPGMWGYPRTPELRLLMPAEYVRLLQQQEANVEAGREGFCGASVAVVD